MTATRRLQNDENIATGQAPVTYVKDVASSMQASTKGKLVATAVSTGLTTKKRVLVEKSINNGGGSSNSSNSGSSTDKEDKEVCYSSIHAFKPLPLTLHFPTVDVLSDCTMPMICLKAAGQKH